MDSEETLDQMSDREILLKLLEKVDGLEKNFDKVSDLERKLDKFQYDSEIQFEAIRTRIVANSADFDRLGAKVLSLSADVKGLTEEVRQNRKTLSLK